MCQIEGNNFNNPYLSKNYLKKFFKNEKTGKQMTDHFAHTKFSRQTTRSLATATAAAAVLTAGLPPLVRRLQGLAGITSSWISSIKLLDYSDITSGTALCEILCLFGNKLKIF